MTIEEAPEAAYSIELTGATGLVYTGSPQDLVESLVDSTGKNIKDFANITVKGAKGNTVYDPINAGTYYVTASYTKNGITYYSDTEEVTIAKAAIATFTAAGKYWPYKGSAGYTAVELIAVVALNNNALSKGTDYTVAFAEGAPVIQTENGMRAVNVGTYGLVVTLNDSLAENYVFTSPCTATTTSSISQVAVDLALRNGDVSITYDGNKHYAEEFIELARADLGYVNADGVFVPLTEGEKNNIRLSSTATTPITNVEDGSLPVVCTVIHNSILTDGNYYLQQGRSKTFTGHIAPKAVTPVFPSVPVEFGDHFDDTIDVSFTGLVGSDALVRETDYTVTVTNPKDTSLGEYSVSVEPNEGGNANYAVQSGTGEVTVVKTMIIPLYESTFTYSENQPYDPEFFVDTNALSGKYSFLTPQPIINFTLTAASENALVKNYQAVNAGEYTLTAELVNSPYYRLTNNTFTVEVLPANANLVLEYKDAGNTQIDWANNDATWIERALKLVKIKAVSTNNGEAELTFDSEKMTASIEGALNNGKLKIELKEDTRFGNYLVKAGSANIGIGMRNYMLELVPKTGLKYTGGELQLLDSLSYYQGKKPWKGLYIYIDGTEDLYLLKQQDQIHVLPEETLKKITAASVGEHTVTAVLKTTDGEVVHSASCTVTIAKGSMDVTALPGSIERTYRKEGYTADQIGTDGLLPNNFISAEILSISNTDMATDVGDYELTVRYSSNSDSYALYQDGEEVESYTKTVTLSIKPAVMQPQFTFKRPNFSAKDDVKASEFIDGKITLDGIELTEGTDYELEIVTDNGLSNRISTTNLSKEDLLNLVGSEHELRFRPLRSDKLKNYAVPYIVPGFIVCLGKIKAELRFGGTKLSKPYTGSAYSNANAFFDGPFFQLNSKGVIVGSFYFTDGDFSLEWENADSPVNAGTYDVEVVNTELHDFIDQYIYLTSDARTGLNATIDPAVLTLEPGAMTPAEYTGSPLDVKDFYEGLTINGLVGSETASVSFDNKPTNAGVYVERPITVNHSANYVMAEDTPTTLDAEITKSKVKLDSFLKGNRKFTFDNVRRNAATVVDMFTAHVNGVTITDPYLRTDGLNPVQLDNIVDVGTYIAGAELHFSDEYLANHEVDRLPTGNILPIEFDVEILRAEGKITAESSGVNFTQADINNPAKFVKNVAVELESGVNVPLDEDDYTVEWEEKPDKLIPGKMYKVVISLVEGSTSDKNIKTLSKGMHIILGKEKVQLTVKLRDLTYNGEDRSAANIIKSVYVGSTKYEFSRTYFAVNYLDGNGKGISAPKDAGSYTLRISPTDNLKPLHTNYSIQGTQLEFTIDPAPAIVTPQDSKVFNSPDPDPARFWIATGDGDLDTEAVNTLGDKISFTREPGEDVGSYAYTGMTIGSESYTPGNSSPIRLGNFLYTMGEGKLTITPQELVYLNRGTQDLVYSGKGYKASDFIDPDRLDEWALISRDLKVTVPVNPLTDLKFSFADGSETKTDANPDGVSYWVKIEPSASFSANYHFSSAQILVNIRPYNAELRVTPKALTFDGDWHEVTEFIDKVEMKDVNGNWSEVQPANYTVRFNGVDDGYEKCNVSDETTITVSLTGMPNYTGKDEAVEAVITPVNVNFDLLDDVTMFYGDEVPKGNVEWSSTTGLSKIAQATLNGLLSDVTLHVKNDKVDHAGEYAIAYAEINGQKVTADAGSVVTGNYNISFKTNGYKLIVKPQPATLGIRLGVDEDTLVYKKDDGYTIEELRPDVYITVTATGAEIPVPESEYDDYGMELCNQATNLIASETKDAGEYWLYTMLDADSSFAKNYDFGVIPATTKTVFTVQKQKVTNASPAFGYLTYDGKPHGIADFWYPDVPAYIETEIDGRIPVDYDDFKFSPADENITTITNAGEKLPIRIELSDELAKNYEFLGGSTMGGINPLELYVKLTTKDLPFRDYGYELSDFVDKVELVDASGKVWETIPEDRYDVYNAGGAEYPYDADDLISVGVSLNYNAQGGLYYVYPNYKIFHMSPLQSPYSCQATAAITRLPMTVSPKQGLWMYYGGNSVDLQTGANLEFTLPDSASPEARELAAGILEGASFTDSFEMDPKPAGKYDYTLLTVDGEYVQPGETYKSPYFEMTFEPKDQFEVKPLPVTVTARRDCEYSYDGEPLRGGYSISVPDDCVMPQDLTDVLRNTMQLVSGTPESSAIGEYDLMLEYNGQIIPSGEKILADDFELWFFSDGHSYVITNEVFGMKVKVEPVTNADTSVTASASGVNADVTLVAHVGETTVTPVLMGENSVDFTATADLPGQTYYLPEDTYEAGHEIGTPVRVVAMGQLRNPGYVTLVDVDTGLEICDYTEVTDGLTVSMKTSGEKYNFGEGSSIVGKNGRIILTTNSDWDEQVILTIGANEPILVKVPAGKTAEIAVDDRFVQAKQFTKGDTLTEVLAEIYRPSTATAVLRVGVDTADPAKNGKSEPFPALVTTPVADGISFVSGFAPAGSYVTISVNNKHYYNDSEGFHIVTREGDDPDSTEDDILYFFVELEKPLKKGDAMFVKWVTPEGAVRRVTIIASEFDEAAKETETAELFGESILGGWWNEDETVFTPEHHFILKLKTDEIGEGMDVPVVARGGYEIGSLHIENADGRLKLSCAIDADKATYEGKYSLKVYSEKPEFDQLHSDILLGDSLNIENEIAYEGDEIWIWAGFEVKDLHLPLQAGRDHFIMINEEAEESE